MKAWSSLILLLFSPLASAQSFNLCKIDPQIFPREVLPKLESGIPFELMAIALNQDRIVSRKIVHISYNLWDEVVIIKSHQKIISKFQLKDGASQLCNTLMLDTSEKIPAGSKIKIRLLLNPMWAERLARLHLSTRADLEKKKLIGIDWKKLSSELASEKVLLEKEVEL